MKNLKNYHGVVVPMVTPLTKDLDVDLEAVSRIIENFARHGAHALIMGTTGEGNSVPLSHGIKMIAKAKETSQGRITIYAGLAGNCVLEQLDAAKQFTKAGADVIAATLPCYYALTPSQMYDYYKRMADFLDIPLMLYNISSTTHMSIPLEVIQKLSQHPNIVGLKDSENNIERMEKALELFSSREDFAYFCGCAANSAKAMSLGADGIVPSVANYYPKLFCDIYEAGLKGDVALANSLQEKAALIGKINTEGLTLGQSLAGLKVIMRMMGLCQEYMLPPLSELSPDVASKIREKAKAIIAEI